MTVDITLGQFLAHCHESEHVTVIDKTNHKYYCGRAGGLFPLVQDCGDDDREVLRVTPCESDKHEVVSWEVVI